MAEIKVLDQETINQIAAGEVIDRPSSVVKELLENAIDADCTAVTVEIREGGLSLIRVTDNGSGIKAGDIPVAFVRHATSKIETVTDLLSVSSLGFRGEALSSIAAVAQVELVTKTADSPTGTRYVIHGGEEKSMEEIGAPEGTTFIVRNLFYNTPARRKFLKTAATEGAYISTLIERMALSRPDISLRFVSNGDVKLFTTGNYNVKDLIYMIYGREVTSNLRPVTMGNDFLTVTGFIGNPVIARGNRNYESYFINERYIKSQLVTKAIEDAYKPYMIQHKFPLTVLYLELDPQYLDVNVHPSKMELRFREQDKIYDSIYQVIKQTLENKELIQQVTWEDNKTVKPKNNHGIPKNASVMLPGIHKELSDVNGGLAGIHIEPSGVNGGSVGTQKEPVAIIDESTAVKVEPVAITDESAAAKGEPAVVNGGPSDVNKEKADLRNKSEKDYLTAGSKDEDLRKSLGTVTNGDITNQVSMIQEESAYKVENPVQEDFFKDPVFTEAARKSYRLIGQLFATYWLIEYQNVFLLIDQHAAHEKVLYERIVKSLNTREFTSQMVNPPLVLTLSAKEELLLTRYLNEFLQIGFEIEHFGGREYAIYAVPDNLFSIAKEDLFIEILDQLDSEAGRLTPDLITNRIASISCKAAVKGNQNLSLAETNVLLDELLTLDNPYVCPHGRPTIISMTRYELEKKFKRIQ